MPILPILEHPAGRWLAVALLHFLWQGVVVAAALTAVLWMFRVHRPTARYRLCLLALAVMAVCPPATVLWTAAFDYDCFGLAAEEEPLSSGVVADSLTVDASIARSADAPPLPRQLEPASDFTWETQQDASLWDDRFTISWDRAQAYVLLTWLAGVIVLALRLSMGMVAVVWMNRGRQPLPMSLSRPVGELCGRLDMKPPGVFLSDRVSEAVAAGLYRPVILLPFSWAMQLSPEMLQAVIAHELAHIRRRDVWMIVFQRAVEVVLFYHPAVWWLSDRLRVERELCCDELAVSATGDRVVYVKTLELLARRKLAAQRLLTAAGMGGRRMQLLDRVQHILGTRSAERRGGSWPAFTAVLGIPLLVWMGAALVVSPVSGDESEAVALDDREQSERSETERDERESAERERERDSDARRERERGSDARRERERGSDARRERERDGRGDREREGRGRPEQGGERGFRRGPEGERRPGPDLERMRELRETMEKMMDMRVAMSRLRQQHSDDHPEVQEHRRRMEAVANELRTLQQELGGRPGVRGGFGFRMRDEAAERGRRERAEIEERERRERMERARGAGREVESDRERGRETPELIRVIQELREEVASLRREVRELREMQPRGPGRPGPRFEPGAGRGEFRGPGREGAFGPRGRFRPDGESPPRGLQGRERTPQSDGPPRGRRDDAPRGEGRQDRPQRERGAERERPASDRGALKSDDADAPKSEDGDAPKSEDGDAPKSDDRD